MLEDSFVLRVVGSYYFAAHRSLNAHVAPEVAARKARLNRGAGLDDFRTGTKIAARRGWLKPHPTSGGMTYHVTAEGRKQLLKAVSEEVPDVKRIFEGRKL